VRHCCLPRLPSPLKLGNVIFPGLNGSSPSFTQPEALPEISRWSELSAETTAIRAEKSRRTPEGCQQVPEKTNGGEPSKGVS
jgi:hypothetical protein